MEIKRKEKKNNAGGGIVRNNVFCCVESAPVYSEMLMYSLVRGHRNRDLRRVAAPNLRPRGRERLLLLRLVRPPLTRSLLLGPGLRDRRRGGSTLVHISAGSLVS